MAFRSDIFVDWSVSPRIIFVKAPATEVTMQDLVDTLRVLEAYPQNMDDASIVSVAGAEDLGGGVAVGLTVTLQNAQLAFQARLVSTSSGTATSNSASGKFLTDTGATFVSDLVAPGATVFNEDDRSAGTVLQVLSETEIRLVELEDGTLNEWTITDTYKIWNEVQCEATGGNLVAVDTTGTTIDALFPTAFTQIVRTSSASATIAELEIANIQRLIETQRTSHVGTGNIIYWDPAAGNNSFLGDSPDRPVLTFARAHDLAGDYNHDIIICQPGDTTGPTVADEHLVISKNHLMVRGPGLDFRIQPSTTGSASVTITGVGNELSSVLVTTAVGGTDIGIDIQNGDQTLVQDVVVDATTSHGVKIEDNTRSLLANVHVDNAGGDGFFITNDVSEMDLKNCAAEFCTGAGFNIAGTGISGVKLRGKGTSSHDNGTYGLVIGTGVADTLIDTDSSIQDNTVADILDQGDNTHYSGIDHSAAFAGAVWIDPSSGVTGTVYPRGTSTQPVDNLTDARSIADNLGLSRYNFRGSITLDAVYDNWKFQGIGQVGADVITLNGQGVDGSLFETCTVTGASVPGDQWDATACRVSDVSLMLGTYRQCTFRNTNTFDAGNTVLHLCGSEVQAGVAPVFEFATAGADAEINGFGGAVTIDGIATAAQLVVLSFTSGSVVINNTCINGEIRIHGVAEVTDNSGTGCTVIRTAQLEASPGAYDGRVHIDTTSGAAGTLYPIGTAARPVSNLTDARTIANAIGVFAYSLRGSITLVSAHTKWDFVSTGSHTDAVIDLNGQDVAGSLFTQISMTGTSSGDIMCHRCLLNNVSGFSGAAEGCGLFGTTTAAAAGSFAMVDCFSMIPGLSTPVLDMNAGNSASGSLRRYSGGLDIRNLDQAADRLSLDYVSGQCIIASSCTAGGIALRGVVAVFDSSAGTSVNRDAQLEAAPGGYDGAVWIDTSGGGEAGTDYPVGTASQPVDNMTDAVTIATSIGLQVFRVRGTLVLTMDHINWQFYGLSSLQNDIIVLNGCNVTKTYFNRITVTGTMTGTDINCQDCILSNVSGMDGVVVNSALAGTITLGGVGSALLGTRLNAIDDPTIIDMVGPGRVAKIAAGGDFEVRNLDTSGVFSLGGNYGTVELASTCIGGSAIVAGITDITDNSGAGCTVQISSLPHVTWEESLSEHVVPGSTGAALQDAANAGTTVLATLAATAGSTTTEVRTNATQADSFYDSMLLLVVNTAGSVARTITSYQTTNGAFTVQDALPFTPAALDTVLVLAIDYTDVRRTAARTALIPALI